MALFLSGVAVFLMAAFWTGISYAQSEQTIVNPHLPDTGRRCSYCHTEEPPALSYDPVSTCTQCHGGNIGNHPVARHPIGKKTRIPIPALLPVTEDDRMVCYTCHEPHNNTRHARMLRESYHRLCAICHLGY